MAGNVPRKVALEAAVAALFSEVAATKIQSFQRGQSSRRESAADASDDPRKAQLAAVEAAASAADDMDK